MYILATLQTMAKNTSFSFYSPKLSIYVITLCTLLFVLFQIHNLQTYPSYPSSPPPTTTPSSASESLPDAETRLLESLSEKLRQTVTFLPLKDLRYADTAMQGHTWFMSSMHDTHEDGEVQHQHFPSKASNGRVLCLKGHDRHDGAWNSYALAWPQTLPHNASYVKGLTFVSYNHYDYGNIWHGLSATFPFVSWNLRYGQCRSPDRWILYHWGEIRHRMVGWLEKMMEAAFEEPVRIETLEGVDDTTPVCFEEAVVMRHNEGGMSRERRLEAYDLMRCRARRFCNVSIRGRGRRGGAETGTLSAEIRMTLLMRTGGRAFRDESVVVEIFQRECDKVEGGRLSVAYSNNLTFCEQVKLMSETDILVSPHGAQLTNMFLMDRNSSVMEFFPKGWLKLAGVGQYVYHWIASWSGMRHQGAWRDPDGENCPYSEDDRRCMSVYKNSQIGYNKTYFAEWTRNILDEVKTRKNREMESNNSHPSVCGCS